MRIARVCALVWFVCFPEHIKNLAIWWGTRTLYFAYSTPTIARVMSPKELGEAALLYRDFKIFYATRTEQGLGSMGLRSDVGVCSVPVLVDGTEKIFKIPSSDCEVSPGTEIKVTRMIKAKMVWGNPEEATVVDYHRYHD